VTYDPNPSNSPALERNEAMTAPGDAEPSTTDGSSSATKSSETSEKSGVHMSYVRFGAMIATSSIVMFFLMYLNSYTWDHVRWSETRAYMALFMGAIMAIIMLGFMLSMYRKPRWNIAIFGVAALVFAGSLALVRSQVTVQDSSWMRAMIPHHSIAILTSERAEIDDVRVCELAEEIIQAQQREIAEMDWLISDIADNGKATTAAEAEARAVPDFEGSSIRSCP